jgi:hypothetical protein
MPWLAERWYHLAAAAGSRGTPAPPFSSSLPRLYCATASPFSATGPQIFSALAKSPAL